MAGNCITLCLGCLKVNSVLMKWTWKTSAVHKVLFPTVAPPPLLITWSHLYNFVKVLTECLQIQQPKFFVCYIQVNVFNSELLSLRGSSHVVYNQIENSCSCIWLEDWQRQRPSSVYFLSNVMHIEVGVLQGHHVPLRVFVDSCAVTAHPDPSSHPRYDVINNHGWASSHGSQARI